MEFSIVAGSEADVRVFKDLKLDLPEGSVICVDKAYGELEATDEEKEAHYWTLDAPHRRRSRARHQRRMQPGEAHTLKAEGVRWRKVVHPWGESHDPEFAPKGRLDRHALHESVQGRDDHLPGRTGIGEPPHLSSSWGSTRPVSRWASPRWQSSMPTGSERCPCTARPPRVLKGI